MKTFKDEKTPKRIIEKERKNDTVVLLGTSNTLINTPWDKKEHDYWACFSVFTQPEIAGHRIDAWFELHPIETWSTFEDGLLRAQEIYPDAPIYMQNVVDKIKNSIKYPLDEIQSSIDNSFLRKYFTSSIPYMIAMAIHKGYKKMILYGISMAVNEEEYSRQRSCAEAWLNYALGKGIKYEIAQPAAIMKCNYMYGYDIPGDVVIKLSQTRDAANNSLDDLRMREQAARDERLIQEGCVRAFDYLIKEYRS